MTVKKGTFSSGKISRKNIIGHCPFLWTFLTSGFWKKVLERIKINFYFVQSINGKRFLSKSRWTLTHRILKYKIFAKMHNRAKKVPFKVGFMLKHLIFALIWGSICHFLHKLFKSFHVDKRYFNRCSHLK